MRQKFIKIKIKNVPFPSHSTYNPIQKINELI